MPWIPGVPSVQSTPESYLLAMYLTPCQVQGHIVPGLPLMHVHVAWRGTGRSEDVPYNVITGIFIFQKIFLELLV